jgi:hypothetical protein
VTGNSAGSPTSSATSSLASSVSSYYRLHVYEQTDGIATSSTSSVITGEYSTGGTSQTPTTSSSISPGAIGGIVVGSILGGALVGALVLVLYNRSKRPVTAAKTIEDGPPEVAKSSVAAMKEPTEVASGRLRYPDNLEREVSGNLSEA